MEKLIIAVDQSTSASKVFLINSQGEILRRFSKAHEQFYPHPAYVEHDASEIFHNVREGIARVTEGLPRASLEALSLSNQRETTVLWDRRTGEPCCHAIVWQDVRSEALCRSLENYAQEVLDKSGLLLSPYYPAAKASHALRHTPDLARKARQGDLCIGTMDSYLIYRLTGGGSFRTDVSNASRTQLMNLFSLKWDESLCSLFGIPMDCLAEILPSDSAFGHTRGPGLPQEILITGVMGDSHASLFGQGCHQRGMAKATFGTGSSMMVNVGHQAIPSTHGLSACVGYGFRGSTCYALEGNVTSSADTLCWLRDEAELIQNIQEVESLSATVPSTHGVYLVPAFSGLGAPYFDGNAKALLYGMNRGTTRAHIVRAALESIAYQDMDVLNAMVLDIGAQVSALMVDGGPTENALLMQLLADLLDCPVQCSAKSEASALGAAYMAGLTVGLFQDMEQIPSFTQKGRRFDPSMEKGTREALVNGWKKAVSLCRS